MAGIHPKMIVPRISLAREFWRALSWAETLMSILHQDCPNAQALTSRTIPRLTSTPSIAYTSSALAEVAELADALA